MRFSIITICYNAEKDIEKTMSSVLNQRFNNYEYIIVDGMSKDNTKTLIEKYISLFKEKGINTKFISENDDGISDAFNKGIKMATGEIICILNSNDCYTENTLQIIDQAFQDDSVDIVYGNCIWIDNENKLKYIRKPENNIELVKHKMPLIHPATFVRKSVYDDVGLFDKSFRHSMDREMVLRMYNAGCKFKYIDKEVVEFTAGGISDKNLKLCMEESKRISQIAGVPKIIYEIRSITGIVKIKLTKSLKKNEKMYLFIKNILGKHKNE